MGLLTNAKIRWRTVQDTSEPVSRRGLQSQGNNISLLLSSVDSVSVLLVDGEISESGNDDGWTMWYEMLPAILSSDACTHNPAPLRSTVANAQLALDSRLLRISTRISQCLMRSVSHG